MRNFVSLAIITLNFCSTDAIAKDEQVGPRAQHALASIANLNKTLAKRPRDIVCLYERAMCRLQLRDYANAISDFNKAISFNPVCNLPSQNAFARIEGGAAYQLLERQSSWWRCG